MKKLKLAVFVSLLILVTLIWQNITQKTNHKILSNVQILVAKAITEHITNSGDDTSRWRYRSEFIHGHEIETSSKSNKTLSEDDLAISTVQSPTLLKLSATEHVHTRAVDNSHFTFADYFSFPHPGGVLKDKEQLLESKWVDELRVILSRRDRTNMIILVSSDYSYITVLLNWLISTVVITQLNLNDVLVLSFDERTHSLLQSREVDSVFVLPFSLFKRNVQPSLWMTRLVVIRLLNHWGFDVAHYDADALVVKDPKPLFERFNKSGVIGSQGSFPSKLSHKWGVTLCAGVMVVKSSPETEDYWQTMSKVLRRSLSDQERLNYALEELHVKWKKRDAYVCRNKCSRSKISSYYVWHKAGQKNSRSKQKTALEGRLWYLHDNWSIHCAERDLVGVDWLKCLRA